MKKIIVIAIAVSLLLPQPVFAQYHAQPIINQQIISLLYQVQLLKLQLVQLQAQERQEGGYQDFLEEIKEESNTRSSVADRCSDREDDIEAMVRAEIEAAGGLATASQVKQLVYKRMQDEGMDECFASSIRAICQDGTTSSSQNRSGTCSWHGGVQSWLY